MLSNAGSENADEVLRELNDYLKTVDADEDKNLYKIIQDKRTQSACDAYLEKAQIRSMCSYVEKYKEYIATANEEQKQYDDWNASKRGWGKVPPLPPGASCWESREGDNGIFWSRGTSLYQPGQRVPVGTKMQAESSWGANVSSL